MCFIKNCFDHDKIKFRYKRMSFLILQFYTRGYEISINTNL